MTASTSPRIVVDALGGDFGCSVVVPGAVRAAQQLGGRAQVICVGDEELVRAEIVACGGADAGVEIVHAPDNIEMSESPATAIRRKPESSIVVGAKLLRDGKGDAFVSAGSTGAVTAASTLIIGRLPGVARPGIAALIPTRRGVTLVLDVGANADCKPQHLLQFAAMGRIYTQAVLGQKDPRVGLLNIGEEPGKGNELTQETYALLRAHEPAFVGNIEGKHLFEGRAHVVVTDGFVGNVVLKMLESFGGFLLNSFREEIQDDLRAKVGALILRPAMKDFARRFHYAEYGGAPLLGCKGLVMIAHGGSSSEAITNAVLAAERGIRDRISQRIQAEIERERTALDAAPPTPEAEASGNDSTQGGSA